MSLLKYMRDKAKHIQAQPCMELLTDKVKCQSHP